MIMFVAIGGQRGRRRSQSRSRDNVADSSEYIDKNQKQSFGRDFVNFYMGKMK